MTRRRRAARSKVVIPRHASFYLQATCCGSHSCKRCGGVAYVHGPYWYATWREPVLVGGRRVQADNPPGRPVDDDVEHKPGGSPGRQRTAYVGAELPEAWMRTRVRAQEVKRGE